MVCVPHQMVAPRLLGLPFLFIMLQGHFFHARQQLHPQAALEGPEEEKGFLPDSSDDACPSTT